MWEPSSIRQLTPRDSLSMSEYMGQCSTIASCRDPHKLAHQSEEARIINKQTTGTKTNWSQSLVSLWATRGRLAQVALHLLRRHIVELLSSQVLLFNFHKLDVKWLLVINYRV